MLCFDVKFEITLPQTKMKGLVTMTTTDADNVTIRTRHFEFTNHNFLTFLKNKFD